MTKSTFICTFAAAVLLSSSAAAEFQAGAACTDVTPGWFPVLVNGQMTSRSVSEVKTPVNARSVAFSDGDSTIVMVIVDSCMLPRDLLDRAKAVAARKTDVSRERILISATHTHTAPSCVGALGTDADPKYVRFIEEKLVEAIEAALQNLEPAQVGYGTVDANEFTAIRRWVLRPDRVREDPFGNPTVRATMHAAREWDDAIGPSGPEDPSLALLSVQSRNGRPIAVVGNFSMHYFGDELISADYFGLFSEGLKSRIQPETPSGKPEFVGVMSHGCSGDIWRRDYALAPEDRDEDITIEDYATALVDHAMIAYDAIEYSVPESIAMQEERFRLDYRKPDAQRLAWSQNKVAELGERLPETRPEIYAREQVILSQRDKAEIVTQAIRLGARIGIATTPTETYALTGLKIKAASPLDSTMVIELANGAEGYIPPPEQHLLGGYNTWNARSAGLEPMAEPKIAEAAIQLLERVSGKNRKPKAEPRGPAATRTIASRPVAYWRLDEFSGPRALDATDNHLDAIYEPQVLFYLEGPRSEAFAGAGEVNRAAHFAGNRLQARIPSLAQDYTVSLWFWNGMPTDGRGETGWIFSRGRNRVLGDEGDHLGIGGQSGYEGKLIFLHGSEGEFMAAGKTPIGRWTWNHLVLTRSGGNVTAYLNGQKEFEVESDVALPDDLNQLFFGGRCDNQSNFEGKLDEIAMFDRALSSTELEALLVRR